LLFTTEDTETTSDILSLMPAQPAFTLGIEEEFQVVDPETRELRSHIQEILEG